MSVCLCEIMCKCVCLSAEECGGEGRDVQAHFRTISKHLSVCSSLPARGNTTQRSSD